MGSHTSPSPASSSAGPSPDAAAPRETAALRRVLDALRRIVRELRLSARDAERSAGISGAQLFVLQALATGPAASLNDLADRTLTDQSSVSVVVRRLTDQKLVSRRASPEDARRIELSLTAAGQRLLARCPEPTQARLLAALRRMAPSELTGLSRGLAALVREMGIDDTEARMFFEEPPARETPRRASEASRGSRGKGASGAI